MTASLLNLFITIISCCSISITIYSLVLTGVFCQSLRDYTFPKYFNRFLNMPWFSSIVLSILRTMKLFCKTSLFSIDYKVHLSLIYFLQFLYLLGMVMVLFLFCTILKFSLESINIWCLLCWLESRLVFLLSWDGQLVPQNFKL